MSFQISTKKRYDILDIASDIFKKDNTKISIVICDYTGDSGIDTYIETLGDASEFNTLIEVDYKHGLCLNDWGLEVKTHNNIPYIELCLEEDDIGVPNLKQYKIFASNDNIQTLVNNSYNGFLHGYKDIVNDKSKKSIDKCKEMQKQINLI